MQKRFSILGNLKTSQYHYEQLKDFKCYSMLSSAVEIANFSLAFSYYFRLLVFFMSRLLSYLMKLLCIFLIGLTFLGVFCVTKSASSLALNSTLSTKFEITSILSFLSSCSLFYWQISKASEYLIYAYLLFPFSYSHIPRFTQLMNKSDRSDTSLCFL